MSKNLGNYWQFSSSGALITNRLFGLFLYLFDLPSASPRAGVLNTTLQDHIRELLAEEDCGEGAGDNRWVVNFVAKGCWLD